MGSRHTGVRVRKMPPDQGSPHGEVQQNKGPKLVVFDDAAEALYQVWCAALDYKGPLGRPLKLWHELANKERRAWRFVLEQIRLQLKVRDLLLVRKPGPNQFTIVTCGQDTWAARVADITSMKSINDLRKLLHEMDLQLALQDEEVRNKEVPEVRNA
jgi:hypothetical protein